MTASPGARPAGGRLDPFYQMPLFSPATKPAVENCKEKAEYLEDPLPLDQMYDRILPHPKSSHGLSIYLSKRGESKLEGFHDRTTHFGNTGMRDTLCDNLNLAGTARWNLNIRHKRALVLVSGNENPTVVERRAKIPAAWEIIPEYYNHSELQMVNRLATTAGVDPPFPEAEMLVDDTGERFFSQYLPLCKPGALKFDGNTVCAVAICVHPLLPFRPTGL